MSIPREQAHEILQKEADCEEPMIHGATDSLPEGAHDSYKNYIVCCHEQIRFQESQPVLKCWMHYCNISMENHYLF